MNKSKDWQKKFLSLPAKKRRKIKLTDKGLPKRRYKKKKVYTKEELMKYVQNNFIYTLARFDKLGLTNDNAPSRHYVYKYFGSWTSLRKTLYGSKGLLVFNEPEKIVIACAEYEILRWRKYLKYRVSEPTLFPSWGVVCRQFGSWKNLRRMIMGRMEKSIISRYHSLALKLGKKPNLKECRNNGVEVDYLFTKISKKDFESFNDEMREIITFLALKRRGEK